MAHFLRSACSIPAALTIEALMQAEVSVLTGERTVLQYFMQPLLRAKGESVTER